MSTQKGIIHLVSSLAGAVVLMALAATFSASAQASTTEVSSAKTAAPVQLAYWHGPGYRPGYYCHRVCWRDRWGYRHCGRRC